MIRTLLNIDRRRVDALQHLLSVESLPDTSSDLPDTITLPSSILAPALAAIARTGKDFRERSIAYRYYKGSWHAGRALTGTAPQVTKEGAIKARAHAGAIIGAILFRPHIFMHTHPDTEASQVYSLLGELENHPRVLAAENKTEGAYPPEAYPLPSAGDVGVYLSNSGGTVGNMVSSAGGHVLLLRNDVQTRSTPFTFQTEDRVRRAKLHLHATSDEAYNQELSAQAVREFMLRATVEATRDVFTCYFSPDPESPILARYA